MSLPLPDRTVGFVIGFSTFLLGCIDYSRLRRENPAHLSDVVIPRCVSRCVVSHTLFVSTTHVDTTRFSGFTLLLFLLFSAFYVWQIISFFSSIRRLVDMYNFYTHLLKIPDVCSVAFLSPMPILSLT